VLAHTLVLGLQLVEVVGQLNGHTPLVTDMLGCLIISGEHGIIIECLHLRVKFAYCFLVEGAAVHQEFLEVDTLPDLLHEVPLQLLHLLLN